MAQVQQIDTNELICDRYTIRYIIFASVSVKNGLKSPYFKCYLLPIRIDLFQAKPNIYTLSLISIRRILPNTSHWSDFIFSLLFSASFFVPINTYTVEKKGVRFYAQRNRNVFHLLLLCVLLVFLTIIAGECLQ